VYDKEREGTGYFLFLEADKCVRIREVEKKKKRKKTKKQKKEVDDEEEKKPCRQHSVLFMHERQ
jgi:hypothetical protein